MTIEDILAKYQQDPVKGLPPVAVLELMLEMGFWPKNEAPPALKDGELFKELDSINKEAP